MENMNLEQLSVLLQNLQDMITQHGNNMYNIQKNYIQGMLETIRYATKNEYSKEQLQQDIKTLFPDKGGLSDFIIWCEDFSEQKRLNVHLNKIWDDIFELI